MGDHIKVKDPLIPEIEYTFFDNGVFTDLDALTGSPDKPELFGKADVRITGLHPSAKPSKTAFNLIMIRHGETNKNLEKTRIKEQKALQQKGSDSDMSYDTEELIDDVGLINLTSNNNLGDKDSELNDRGVLRQTCEKAPVFRPEMNRSNYPVF